MVDDVATPLMRLDASLILLSISFRPQIHHLHDQPVLLVPKLSKRFKELSTTVDLGPLCFSLGEHNYNIAKLLQAEKPKFHYKVDLLSSFDYVAVDIASSSFSPFSHFWQVL